jgi:uncharacterized Fe-S center protein
MNEWRKNSVAKVELSAAGELFAESTTAALSADDKQQMNVAFGAYCNVRVVSPKAEVQPCRP